MMQLLPVFRFRLLYITSKGKYVYVYSNCIVRTIIKTGTGKDRAENIQNKRFHAGQIP